MKGKVSSFKFPNYSVQRKIFPSANHVHPSNLNKAYSFSGFVSQTVTLERGKHRYTENSGNIFIISSCINLAIE